MTEEQARKEAYNAIVKWLTVLTGSDNCVGHIASSMLSAVATSVAMGRKSK